MAIEDEEEPEILGAVVFTTFRVGLQCRRFLRGRVAHARLHCGADGAIEEGEDQDEDQTSHDAYDSCKLPRVSNHAQELQCRRVCAAIRLKLSDSQPGHGSGRQTTRWRTGTMEQRAAPQKLWLLHVAVFRSIRHSEAELLTANSFQGIH